MKTCLVVVVAMVLSGCWREGVKGSGQAKAEVRSVAAFTALDISGAIRVEVTVAPEPRVEVSGDDNLVPLIDTLVDGSSLKIRNRESVRPDVPLVVRVAAPTLTAIAASGATIVALHGRHDDQLAIKIHGAATLRGDGTAQQLTIEASGSGTLDLDQLVAARASVTSSGASTVSVNVSRSLDVHATGASTVTYRGDPPDGTREASTAATLTKR